MFGIPGWAIGVAFIVVVITVSHVGTALIRLLLPSYQLRGRKASGRDLAQALDEVQRRLGDVEQVQRRLGEAGDVQTRLGELEERVDFAERLLAQQRDAERLAPPKL
jgi:predicted nuclease with TOPRIM domain